MSDRVKVDLSEVSGIPEGVLEKLNNATLVKDVNVGRTWQDWEDAVLLKSWGILRQTDLCEALGVSVNTCRKRYRFLTGGKN